MPGTLQQDETFGLTERDWHENYEAVDHYRAVVHEAGHRAADRRLGRALLPSSRVWKGAHGVHAGREFSGYLAPLPRADARAVTGMAGQAAEQHWIQQMQRRGLIPEQAPGLAHATREGAGADHEGVQTLISRGLCSYTSLQQAWDAAWDWVRRSENWRYVIGNTAFVTAKCHCAPLSARSDRNHPTPATAPPSAAAPVATTTTTPAPSTKGTTMSGIDEIRAAIAQVTETAQGASAQHAQITMDLDQATALLHQIAATSARPEPGEALGGLVELTQQGHRAAAQLQAITQQLESYVASL